MKPRQILFAYKEGYTVFDFLVNKYGKETIAIMTEDIQNQINSYWSIEKATKGQVDQSIRHDWENYLKENTINRLLAKRAVGYLCTIDKGSGVEDIRLHRLTAKGLHICLTRQMSRRL